MLKEMSDKGFTDSLVKQVVELELHIKFLEKQLSTAKLDAVAAFGAELLNEHEHCFIGGEVQIQAICQVVLVQVI